MAPCRPAVYRRRSSSQGRQCGTWFGTPQTPSPAHPDVNAAVGGTDAG